MSKRKKSHDLQLEGKVVKYATSRALDFHKYSDYHMRLSDGGYTTVDIWTTRRYYVLHTDYSELSDKELVERGGEKGFLPTHSLEKWLDDLFFAAEQGQS